MKIKINKIFLKDKLDIEIEKEIKLHEEISLEEILAEYDLINMEYAVFIKNNSLIHLGDYLSDMDEIKIIPIFSGG